MSRVDTDKKLELVRTIRMQDQYNRQLCRSREQLLYSDNSGLKKGEIYGLETAAIPVVDRISRKTDTGTGKEQENGGLLKGFRIRLVIAMLLFLAFVFCDVKGIGIGAETMDTLFERMTEISLPEYFSSMILEKIQ